MIQHERAQRRLFWKWRFLLPASAIVFILAVDIVAMRNGFSLESTDDSWIHAAAFFINFCGIIVAYVFGDILAKPGDPIHQWNLMVFLAGGACSWIFFTFALGYCLDRWKCRRRVIEFTGSREIGNAGECGQHMM